VLVRKIEWGNGKQGIRRRHGRSKALPPRALDAEYEGSSISLMRTTLFIGPSARHSAQAGQSVPLNEPQV
jgi:hypothetical protein